MAIDATNNSGSSFSDRQTGYSGVLGHVLRSAYFWIGIILAVLAGAQVAATGIHEVQGFLFLGYFMPIAIAARYLPRSRALAVTAVSTAIYALAFIPDMLAIGAKHGELSVELMDRIAMFMAAGIVLSSFRFGLTREKERALRAERDRADRLRLMLEISTTVSSSLKIDQVLQLLAERIVEAVDATFCSVFLLEGDGDYLRIVAAHPSRDLKLGPPIGMTIPLSQLPDFKKAIETKSAVIAGGRRLESIETKSSHFQFLHDVKSLMVYPLVVGEKAVGAVAIGEHRDWKRSPMTMEKTALCQTIVNQGAVAVGHALNHQALEEAFVGTIRSLAEAIDAKDPSTRGHSDWVSKYALMIGRQMGLTNGALDELKYAGYLHDVGKIGIPDEILSKSSQLSPDEWKLMKKHPIVSARILEPVPISGTIKASIRHHHERFDGKGYPYGLAGESIPLAARILSVADSYEAMTSDRPYRQALSDEQAVTELVRCCGTQFDPGVVDSFLKSLGRTPVSSASSEGESLAG
ncbi:MAG: HD domain-containing phosphohydrolase [Thermoleophilia bacterium]